MLYQKINLHLGDGKVHVVKRYLLFCISHHILDSKKTKNLPAVQPSMDFGSGPVIYIGPLDFGHICETWTFHHTIKDKIKVLDIVQSEPSKVSYLVPFPAIFWLHFHLFFGSCCSQFFGSSDHVQQEFLCNHKLIILISFMSGPKYFYVTII